MADILIYKTKDFEFDFSKREIRLYRKRYNYRTIPFTKVKNVEVSKGSSVRNVWFLAIISGLLFFLTIFLSYNLFERLGEAEYYAPLNHSDIRGIGANIVISASSLFFASYILYAIIRKDIVLKINRNKTLFPLNELARDGMLKQFYEDLKNTFTLTNFDLNES